MVKMRPPAMDRLDQPVPTLLPLLTDFEFHRSLGPAAGHSRSSPVSEEMASRCGPRHCSQSRCGACAAALDDVTMNPRTAITNVRMQRTPSEEARGGGAKAGQIRWVQTLRLLLRLLMPI